MRFASPSCLLLALCLISHAGVYAASPQSDLDRAMSPHSSTVKSVLADAPGIGVSAKKTTDRKQESSACRSLRMQMERARSAEPVQNNAVPRLSRDGQYTSGIPKTSPYGEAGRLEAEYLSECS